MEEGEIVTVKTLEKITALGVEVRSLKSVFLMSAMLTTLAG